MGEELWVKSWGVHKVQERDEGLIEGISWIA